MKISIQMQKLVQSKGPYGNRMMSVKDYNTKGSD